MPDLQRLLSVSVLLAICCAVFAPSAASQAGATSTESSKAPVDLQEVSAPARFLFRNVALWDGIAEQRVEGVDVLVEDRLVKAIGVGLEAPADARVLECDGRTLMPGLIDMHTHLMFKYGVTESRNIDHASAGAMALETMQGYMQMGYTSLREVGGSSLGLARTLAAGRLRGPRLYSSGGAISAISGHNDLALLTEDPHEGVFCGRGDTMVVTGADEVRAAVRTLLRGGATHIKLMVGGGVASQMDPLEATTLTEEEIRAAVEVAADFGTYTCAHAYTTESVNRYLDAGGRMIEHGFLVDEATIIRMKELGAVMSLQPYAAYEVFKAPEEIPGFSAENVRKGRQVHQGADQMLTWVAEHGVKTIAGSDLWTYNLLAKVPDDMVLRKRWFDDVEILRQNTSYAGKWLMKSGPKNPYKAGALGVIAEGSYADLLIVDGNPLEDVTVLKDYQANIRFVMKDGEVFKDTL